MPNTVLGPTVVKRAERKSQALTMRKAGASWADIGEALGVSPSQAFRLAKDALTAMAEEDAEFMRQLMAERLDDYHRRVIEVSLQHTPVLHKGQPVWVTDERTGRAYQLRDRGPELRAIHEALRIQESYRRLFGLDAAQRFEHSGPDGGAIPVEERRAEVQEGLLGRISHLRALAAGELPPASEDGD